MGSGSCRRLDAALRAALERRHHALSSTAALSPAVLDSLVLVAAGSWDPQAVQDSWDAVENLQAEMEKGRRRLIRLGFTDGEAAEMAALHTSNFM